MPHVHSPWEALYAHPGFSELVEKRRAITLRLFGVSMAIFFSIPVLSTFFPALFRAPVIGSINLGLVFLLSQFIMGGLVGWRYAVQLRRIDGLSGRMVEIWNETAARTAATKA